MATEVFSLRFETLGDKASSGLATFRLIFVTRSGGDGRDYY